MDDSLIYVKTEAGELAMRERTRLIQRNLRMVLILVEGQTTVAALKAKVNDDTIVETALVELEQLGLIEPVRVSGRKGRRGDSGRDDAHAMPAVEDVTGPPVSNIDSSMASESADVLSQSVIPTQPPREYAALFADVPTDMPTSGDTGGRRVVRVEDVLSVSPPDSSAKDGHEPWHLAKMDVRSAFDRIRQSRLFREPDKEEEEFERAYRDDAPEPVKIKRIRKGARSPLVWPLRIAVGALVLVLALAGIAAIFPFDHYRPQMEAAATRTLHSPVKIESVRFAFTPYPNLTLERIVVGGAAPYAWIERARVVPDVLALFGDATVVRSLDVATMRVSVASVDRCVRWLQGGPDEFALRNLKIANIGLDLGGTSFEGLAAEGVFKPQGGLSKLLLASGDQGFRIEAEPAGNIFRLTISGATWPVPLRPAMSLSSLDAKGELTGQQLRIPKFVAELSDGLVEGSGTFDWSDGASLVGDVELKHVDMGKLSATFDPDLAISGELNGRARIESRAKTPAALLDGLHLDGTLTVNRAVLNHFDFVEAVRTSASGPVRSGSTRVDQVDVKLACDETACRASGIRMTSGPLRGEGRLSVVRKDRRLDGMLSVELRGTANNISAPVGIAGTLDRPELMRRQ